MKFFLRLTLVAALAFGVALAPASAELKEWKFDPNHSYVGFKVRHMMVSWVRGQFTGVSGTIWYDAEDPTKSRVEIAIDPSTIDTRNERRDKHLRSPDFFDVEKYPEMKFVSTKVAAAGEGKLSVTGDLTLHGVTKSVVLEIEGPAPSISDGRGGRKTGASASVALKRSEFGLAWSQVIEAGGVAVGDEIFIEIEAELNGGG